MPGRTTREWSYDLETAFEHAQFGYGSWSAADESLTWLYAALATIRGCRVKVLLGDGRSINKRVKLYLQDLDSIVDAAEEYESRNTTSEASLGNEKADEREGNPSD